MEEGREDASRRRADDRRSTVSRRTMSSCGEDDNVSNGFTEGVGDGSDSASRRRADLGCSTDCREMPNFCSQDGCVREVDDRGFRRRQRQCIAKGGR